MSEQIYVPRTMVKISYSVEGGASDLNLEKVKWLVQKVLNDALEDTIFEIEDFIKQFVPKRSGDLQEDLIKYLGRSIPPPIAINELRGIRLVLGASVEVDYIKYVDQMADAQVQHFGTWLEHSGKRAYSKGKPVFLDDPTAEGQFFSKMIKYGKERLLMNLDKAKYKLESIKTSGELG